MKRILPGLAIGTVLAVAAAAIWFNPANLVASRQQANDDLIAEKMAASVGFLAYLYGFPLVDMYRQMHNETHRVSEDQQVLAPVNRFYHFPSLVTPESAGNLRAPNNDTLYYSAWFDVSEQPLILHTPDTSGRYFTIAVTNLYAEVTHIGRRTHGTEEAYYALIGPRWRGTLPPGLTAIPVESEQGWLLGRMLVDGPEDFVTAKNLVDQIWAATLPEFIPGQPPASPVVGRAQAIDPRLDIEFFTIMNQLLRELPRRPAEAALMAQFDAIGIGPGVVFEPATADPAALRGLEQAIAQGNQVVNAGNARTIPDFNGWMISRDIGRYGFDFMHRAAVANGGYGNLPEESLYPAALLGDDGTILSGHNRYRVHFPAGQLPPVDGFWSLSVYNLDEHFSLVKNPLGRHSIGDRTKDLKYNVDGSLTLLLQQDAPPEGSNWMPVPPGYFMTVMRLYEPQQAALDNRYRLPRIEKID